MWQDFLYIFLVLDLVKHLKDTFLTISHINIFNFHESENFPFRRAISKIIMGVT